MKYLWTDVNFAESNAQILIRATINKYRENCKRNTGDNDVGKFHVSNRRRTEMASIGRVGKRTHRRVRIYICFMRGLGEGEMVLTGDILNY